ncbi:pilus assembly FimT family protein [Sulfuricurvum sp.]|uniref:pilus assembly FimT family protein n=1 Tax=Sulfuricurvum sp. TaxID=2025608 RepID=UPI003BB03390
MVRRGFTFFEVILAIALIGVMGTISFYYLNVSTLTSTQQKAQLQSHITLLTSMILECKTLSEIVPKQVGGAAASSTPIRQLECQTTPVYLLDGGKSGFIPLPPGGFDPYTASESGGSFFITLSANQGSSGDTVLQSIIDGYSATQASLHYAGGKALLDIYLSH